MRSIAGPVCTEPSVTMPRGARGSGTLAVGLMMSSVTEYSRAWQGVGLAAVTAPLHQLTV